MHASEAQNTIYNMYVELPHLTDYSCRMWRGETQCTWPVWPLIQVGGPQSWFAKLKFAIRMDPRNFFVFWSVIWICIIAFCDVGFFFILFSKGSSAHRKIGTQSRTGPFVCHNKKLFIRQCPLLFYIFNSYSCFFTCIKIWAEDLDIAMGWKFGNIFATVNLKSCIVMSQITANNYTKFLFSSLASSQSQQQLGRAAAHATWPTTAADAARTTAPAAAPTAGLWTAATAVYG